jgi:hypothetical protein
MNGAGCTAKVLRDWAFILVFKPKLKAPLG